MVKGKETQGWELPLALITLKQGCGSGKDQANG